MFLSFIISFACFISFFLYLAGLGKRRKGRPTRIDHFDLGQDRSIRNPAAAREGSGKPLPWPFGPHAEVNK